MIKVLRAMFMNMGIPEEMTCDGGKNLNPYEMKAWLKEWGLKIRPSSAD